MKEEKEESLPERFLTRFFEIVLKVDFEEMKEPEFKTHSAGTFVIFLALGVFIVVYFILSDYFGQQWFVLFFSVLIAFLLVFVLSWQLYLEKKKLKKSFALKTQPEENKTIARKIIGRFSKK